MNSITFNEAIEEIKSSGSIEKETIEIAEEISRIVGDIAEARFRSGLTQRQLAEKSGIKQSAIARMESLQAIPRLDTLVKIARCLDVKINVDSISTEISKMGIVVSLQNYRANTDNYRWNSASSDGFSANYARKEPTNAAIG